MPIDALYDRLGHRFIVVTLLPNLAFVVFVGALLAAGAPSRRPSWDSLSGTITDMSAGGLVLAGIATFVASMAIHPLQYPLIQLVEGYWIGLPFGATLAKLAAEPIRKEHKALSHFQDQQDVDEHDATEAQERRRWLPVQADLILPSALGNTLLAGEHRAGYRYHYNTLAVFPRLIPLMSASVQSELTELRNQMDVAVRICVLNLLAVVVGMTLLIRHDVWLLLPLGCYLLAWVSYRAAIAAAKHFSEAMAVAFDLHHLDLWDAMSLDRPRDVDAVRQEHGENLSNLLAGRPLRRDQYRRLTYQPRPEPPPWPGFGPPPSRGTSPGPTP